LRCSSSAPCCHNCTVKGGNNFPDRFIDDATAIEVLT
jgi:hypothetical protein